MQDHPHTIPELGSANQQLHDELNYYRSLLFADSSPQGVSIVNALRHAVDIVEENKRFRNGEVYVNLKNKCDELRKELESLQGDKGNVS